MALYKTITGWGVDWRDEYGKRHRRFVGSEEAAKALEATLRSSTLESKARVAALTTGAGLHITEAAQIYIAHVGTVAPSTRKRYKLTCEVLARTVGDIELAAVTPTLLRDYLKQRAQEIAPATLDLEARTLKNLFRFLRAQDHIASDPSEQIVTTRPPPQDRR